METVRKTPIMVLMEVVMKQKLQTPIFELMPVVLTNSTKNYTYKVSMMGINVLATEKCKKIAKHKAAYKLLQELAKEKNIYHPDYAPETDGKSLKNISCPESVKENYIGILVDICKEYRIGFLKFVEISSAGPSHRKDFTYECQLDTLKTRGTANSKTAAKQMAAKHMIEKPFLNELAIETLKCSDNNNVSPKYENIQKAKVKNRLIKRLDSCSKKELYFKAEALDMDTLKKCFEGPPSEENIKELAGQFDMEFKKEVIQTDPYIVSVSLEAGNPITAHGMDQCDIQIAFNKALQLFTAMLQMELNISL